MLPRDRALLDTLDPVARDRALLLWERTTPILEVSKYLLSLPGQVAARRTLEQQQALWAKGRALVGKDWVVIDKGRVVTKCDGIVHRSRHQDGVAIDLGLRIRSEISGRLGTFVWYQPRTEAGRLFEAILREARALGWSCGMDWAWRDPHHVELSPDSVV